MSNVLQLFKQEKIENPPEPKTIMAIAVASILSSKGQLARAVEELSKHLDAVGQTIDPLGDTDPRIRVVHAAKLDRKRLTKAMLELSQGGRKTVGYTTRTGRSGCSSYWSDSKSCPAGNAYGRTAKT
jgi:hypothetical protein